MILKTCQNLWLQSLACVWVLVWELPGKARESAGGEIVLLQMYGTRVWWSFSINVCCNHVLLFNRAVVALREGSSVRTPV